MIIQPQLVLAVLERGESRKRRQEFLRRNCLAQKGLTIARLKSSSPAAHAIVIIIIRIVTGIAALVSVNYPTLQCAT